MQQQMKDKDLKVHWQPEFSRTSTEHQHLAVQKVYDEKRKTNEMS